MRKRRQINADHGARNLHATVSVATGPVREVAWIVEERVMWRGADLLHALLDAVKWPFERLAWLVERRLIWPIQERDWSRPHPAAGAGLLAAVVLGACALAVVTMSGGKAEPQQQVAAPARVAVAAPTPAAKPRHLPSAAVLHGAAPVFAPPSVMRGQAQAGVHPARPAETAHTETAAPADASSATASAAPGEVAGAAAIGSARSFANAFVRYETGQVDTAVRASLRATTTPQLGNELLSRLPRMPANVKVPQAKVLNVVPGPQLRDNCTVSVSLLRVGLTSELRLSMHRAKNGTWLVNHVLG